MLRRGSIVGVVVVGALTLASWLGQEPCPGDRGPVREGIAAVERWLEALSVPDGMEGGTTLDVRLTVAPLSPGAVRGASTEEIVALHGSFLPAIHRALDAGDRVFLGLAAKGLEREMVSHVLIGRADGAIELAGGCGDRDGETLRRVLGDRHDETLLQVVGTTGRERILRLLARTPWSGYSDGQSV